MVKQWFCFNSMTNLIFPRKRKRDHKDYTKEPLVKWFIYLLIILAAYMIIHTLTSDRVKETKSESGKGASVVEQITTSESLGSKQSF
jgi:hypothetical protein